MPVKQHGLGAVLKWQLSRKQGPWEDWTDARPGPPPPRSVPGQRLRVTFVNHSTVLIQTSSVNFLTDPIWSERCSPVPWAGPRRVRPPGIRLQDLPRIHVVLISHNHYDHLDLPTLERLERLHRPLFIVGLGNGKLLRKRGIKRVVEIDWWHYYPLKKGLRVVSVPAQHFSNRGLCDRDATLWTGFVITAPGGPVYYAGDTGFGPHFQQVATVYAPLRLAILPIGAFQPRWFMSRMHISPGEAVQAHGILRARTSMAVHFGTFRLGDDGQHEPARRLLETMATVGVPAERFWIPGFGEGREIPALTRPQAVPGS